ncbi:hypothetical protein ACWF94_23275 [Streptomyces sp. NPDC055078]
MTTTTIQVSRETRDQFAALAEERGPTVGQLVEALVAEQRTARVAADREVARWLTGVDIRDTEFDQAPDILGNIRRIAAGKARTTRR